MHVSLLKKCFLLKVQSDILMSMDNQEIKLLVLLDLTAAFDTINHKILLDVLENNFGIIGSAHDWFAIILIYLIESKVFISTTGLRMISIWAVVSCREAASAQFCLFCTFHSLIKLSSCILPMWATMTIINYEIKEFSDINHSTRTLGWKLYAHKGKVKGLTPTIIAYIQKCFT